MRPIERIKIYLNLLETQLKSINDKFKPDSNENEFVSTISKFEPDSNENEFVLTLSNNTNDFYKKLEKIWLENPDWRFTQLCVNTGIIPNVPGMWYYTEDFDLMLLLGFEPRDVMLWGTCGKDGKQPLSYILLKDMTTDHIEAVLKTQKNISNNTLTYFQDELELRKKLILTNL